MVVTIVLAGIAILVCLGMLPFARTLAHRTRAALIIVVVWSLALAWINYVVLSYAAGHVPDLHRRNTQLISLASHPYEALAALIIHIGIAVVLVAAGSYVAWHYYKLHRAQQP